MERCNSSLSLMGTYPSAQGSQTYLEGERICLPLPHFIPNQAITPCAGRAGLQDAEQLSMEREQWNKNK